MKDIQWSYSKIVKSVIALGYNTHLTSLVDKPTKCKQSLHQNILMHRNAYILFLTITSKNTLHLLIDLFVMLR